MAKQVIIYANGLRYDISKYCTFPITYTDDISKLLDTANIAVPLVISSIEPMESGFPLPTSVNLDMSEPIKPASIVQIIDEGDKKNYFIRENNVEVMMNVGQGELYSHQISAIEGTKLTELKPVPDLAITQPKSQQITISQQLVPTTTTLPLGVETTLVLEETSLSNDVTVIDGTTLKEASREYSILCDFKLSIGTISTEQELTYRIYANGVEIATKTVTYIANVFAATEINEVLNTTYTTSIANEVITVTVETDQVDVRVDDTVIDILSVETIGDTQLITFDEVIDKAILSYEVIDMNNTTSTNEITLDSDTRAKLSNIVSPELTFSKYTLWDILEELADIIKAIPRLEIVIRENFGLFPFFVSLQIKFDFVDELNKVPFTNTYQTSNMKSLVLEDYVNSLEINADNVVESVERQNEVVEPYKSGWFTLRSSQDGPEQITDTTLGIRTRFKQYEMKQVLAKGFLVEYSDASSDAVTREWDITDYVIEQERWRVIDNLPYDSAVDRATVNYGKGNTLYFSSGGDRLLNFGYRSPKSSSIALLPDQAIYQIIAAVATQVTGKTVTAVKPNGGSQNLDNILETQYRITHVATITARAKVWKPNANTFERNLAKYSNEKAKVNDTAKLGDYNQSLLNRIGNRLRKVTGTVELKTDLPQIGNIVGNKEIVTRVNVRIENGGYDFDAWLYDDYSAISSFVSVVSEYRQYEVPNTDIVERILNYDQALLVSRDTLVGEHCIITDDGFDELTKPLRNTAPSGMTYHTLKTRESVKVPTDTDWNTAFDTESEGPVDIKHFGTTTYIKVETKSNFAVDDTKEDLFVSTVQTNFQNEFTYKDLLGRFDSARYSFYIDGFIDNSVADGEVYPEILLTTSADKLIELDVEVKADAREKIDFGINIPFYSDDLTDLKIYNGMAKYNGFAFQGVNADIVAIAFKGNLPTVEQKTIGNTKYFEATSYVGTLSTVTNGVQIAYTIQFDPTYSDTFNGWGLMDRNTNELLFLCNEEIIFVNGVTKNVTDTIRIVSRLK